MSVRLKIAITIFVTGALTALGVIATVLFAFQRFEHETTYHRANAFLGRVVAMYDNIFELHERHPDEFTEFLKNLVLFEPDAQLYLLDAQGTVLATSAAQPLRPGYKVSLAPVQQATGRSAMPFVMGDDPARMNANRGDRRQARAPHGDPQREPIARATSTSSPIRWRCPKAGVQVVGHQLREAGAGGGRGVVVLATLLHGVDHRECLRGAIAAS
jgi:hypothetical protein